MVGRLRVAVPIKNSGWPVALRIVVCRAWALMLVSGAWGRKLWSLAPVSAMAWSEQWGGLQEDAVVKIL